MDVNWSYGTLVSPPAPKEPKSLKEGDSSVAALLDEAEDIVNRAGPAILAELEAEDIEQWANSAPRGMRPKHRKRRRLGKLLRRQRKK